MVEFHGTESPAEKLSYVVIAARYNGGWLFVRHRERGGYELPAGHPEAEESSEEAAARELREETGAVSFTLEPVGYYSVGDDDCRKYGRLFIAFVSKVGTIIDHSEIEATKILKTLPDHLSLAEVMTFLFHKAEEYIALYDNDKEKGN